MSNPPEPIHGPHANGSPSVCGSLFCRWCGILGVLGLLILAFQYDQQAVAYVRANAHGWGKWLAGRVSYWGDWYGVFAIGFVVWGIGKLRHDRGIQRTVVLMGVCAALSGLGANMSRGLTGRTRPFAHAEPGWYGITRGIKQHDFQSFPSAHTAVVAGFFAPLALIAMRSRRRRARIAGCAVALSGTLLMAWARVWDGKHHLSDVLAASLLGLGVGLLLIRREDRRNGLNNLSGCDR